MPITWRNVDAPSNADAMRGFQIAGQGIGSAFDKLGSLVADRQAVNQGVVDRADEAGVQRFLDVVAKARTPEQVAAMQASGELDAMRAALNPKNLGRVRGAEDARLASVQKQITDGNAFADGLVTREQTNAINAIQRPVALDNAAADAANAQPLRDLARAAITQRQVLEPITNRTAVTVANNAGRAAVFAGEQAPLLEANATKEAVLKGSTLTTAQKQQADLQEDQALTALTARATQVYQAAQAQGRQKLGLVAGQLKLPLDAVGAPDVGKMTAEQRKLLDQHAKTHGLPSTNDLFSGDTQEANKFITSLAGDARFTPEGIARNQARLTGAFSTTGSGAPIGNDALNIATKQAEADVRQKETDSRNWYAPGSQDALNDYESLVKEISPLFVGTDMAEDLPDMQNLIYKAATTGIEISPGKFLAPSRQDMLAAVRSQMGNYNVFNKSRANQVEKFLKGNLDKERVTELLAQAEESKAANRVRDTRAAVKELLNPTPPKK